MFRFFAKKHTLISAELHDLIARSCEPINDYGSSVTAIRKKAVVEAERSLSTKSPRQGERAGDVFGAWGNPW